MLKVHSVLQIPHGLGPGARILAGLTRPDKIRHGEIAEVEIAVPVVLSDGLNVLHHGLYDAGRDDDAPSVVEQHICITIAIVSSCDLTHRMQGPCDICNVPPARDLAVDTFNVGHTPPDFSITSPPAPEKCVPDVFGVTFVPAGNVFG